MTTNIETLKKGENIVLPRTTTKAITTEDGTLLDDAIKTKANDNEVYHEWKFIYDGEELTKDGVVQSFEQVAEAVNDKSKFVYIVFQNRLYIPQYQDNGLVSFSCSYLDGNTPTIRRIRVTNTGITTTVETSYNKSEIDNKESDLKEDLATKLTSPENPVVGKILKVLSVNDDGTFVCEWGDAPSGGVSDVTIVGSSVVTGGVANIKYADTTTAGVVKVGTYGIRNIANGMLGGFNRTASQFVSDSAYYLVSSGTLRNVLSAPSLLPELTAAEQKAAQERIGILSVEEVLF